MSKGRHIRAVGGDDGASEKQATETGEVYDTETPLGEDPTDDAYWDEEPLEPKRSRRIWPLALAVLTVLLGLAWTALFVWVHRDGMVRSTSLDQWTAWISQWAGPLLLLGVAWLIGMRSSAREANRFGDAARVLAQESAVLETRLVTVNRELSLAREFLAAQSRELDYLGRAAAEKISEHAGRLQELVADNGAQVDAIAGVSVTALENMTQLRDHLPVVANSARDVSNQIGGAGRTAQGQLAELVSGFERLNDFGEASERQVASLHERVEATLEALGSFADEIDTANNRRVDALQDRLTAHRAELESREIEVLSAMQHRGEVLREELVAAHDARQLEEATALAAMRNRIAAFTQEAHDAAAAIRAGEQAAKTAWESHIDELRHRLETALSEIAVLDQQALDRAREKLAALTAEAEAVDARMLERDRQFEDRIAARNEGFEQAEDAAIARIAERGEQLDRDLAERYEAQIAQVTVLREAAEALASRVGEIGAHVDAIVERSGDAETALSDNAARFAHTVSTHAGELSDAEGALSRLTDASVRLLELIQATAQHSRDQLPVAIEGFETKLGNARADSDAIRDTLSQAREIGSGLSNDFDTLHAKGQSTIGDLEDLRARLSGTAEEQSAALRILHEDLAAASVESRNLADGVNGALAEAIGKVREDGRAAIADFERSHGAAIEGLREQLADAGAEERDRLAKSMDAMSENLGGLRAAGAALFGELDAGNEARIASLSRRIGDSSAEAIDRAIEARTEDSIARLDEATAQSTEAAREAVAQMRDQLARVHELTVNLESRASRAREQVEEQVDNDFSRRVALITESLNSHSIDIAKALSTEVTDTAWASYLKGDRGIFTRRAVRLIDNSEAREISELYEADHEFREHVSRYIHDFEAMLRIMLSTRDGHSLGVTLLSSDMGKLYVAMAQAIQRLRQ